MSQVATFTSQQTPAGSRSRLAPAIRRHGWFVLLLLVILLPYTWLLTYGDWDLLARENYGRYYDDLAVSILHGKLDVPYDAILGEAFVRDGKNYGYFGIGPALLRIPLHLIKPSMNGRWSRLFMLLSHAIGLIYAYRVVWLLRMRRTSFNGPARGALSRGVSAEQSQSRSNAPQAVTLNGGASPQQSDQRIAAAFGTSEQNEQSSASSFDWTSGQRAIVAVFLLALGWGSSALFLASRSYIYHEATMVGAAAAIVCCYYFIAYARKRTITPLLLAGIAAFFSFFGRPTAGAGCVLAMLLLGGWLLLSAMFAGNSRGRALPPTRHPLRHAILSLGIGLFILGSYFGMNYIKFRTLDGVPVNLYSQYLAQPERMKVTQGKQIHLVNFRTCARAYLRPDAYERHASFPWVYMTQTQHVYPGTRIDAIEPTSSFPFCQTALCGFAILGLCWIPFRARAAFLPVATLAAGGGIIFVTVGITQRYLHDLYPFFAIAGAAGVVALGSIRWGIARWLVAVLFLPVVLFNAAVQGAFAIEYQRVICWGVPLEKTLAYQRFRGNVDAMMGNGPSMEMLYGKEDAPPPSAARPGQLWVSGSGTTYWYNGQEWIVVRSGKGSTPEGAVHLRMRLTQWRPGDDEPLLTTGRFEAGDVVYLRHLAPGSAAFGFDHWGLGGSASDPVKVELNRWYDLVIHQDRVNQQIVIQLDGRTVLKKPTPIFPTTPEQVEIGKNNIGGWPPGPEPFFGELERITD